MQEGREMYQINIVNEVHIKVYLHKIKKYLEKKKATEVVMVGCGSAIVNLLLISDIMSEYYQRLYRVNSIRYDKC